MYESYLWNNYLHGANDLVQTENLAAEPALPESVSIDVIAPFDIGYLIYVTGRPFETGRSY